MPLYFFHTRNGGDYADDVGTELADDATARSEAIVAAGAVIKDLAGDFWAGQDWSMRVESETGDTVCELLFTAKPRG
jgi:hypothetical protein